MKISAELARARILHTVRDAEESGLVVTVEQVPTKPFRMGAYVTKVSVRQAHESYRGEAAPAEPGQAVAQAPAMTCWMSSYSKPTRFGVYQRLHDTGWICYSMFDPAMNEWKADQETPELAARSYWNNNSQSLPWRGLAEDPSK